MFRINGTELLVERFPDQTILLDIVVDTEEITIEWLFEKDEEMQLFFIVKHLREKYPVRQLNLYMPYIPHARMDRVKDRERVFTLKYFCEFINAMEFDRVIVRDAHSDVSLALLDRVVTEPIAPPIKALMERLLNPERDIVFYPDEGSCKRYSDLLEFPCAFGIKKRDWNSGKILGLEVQGEIPKAPFHALIVDDISSYGGTFYHAAKKLKELGAEKIYLYVTHCENSILKGDLIQSGLLTKIYTTRSIFSGSHPLIEILGGKEDEPYQSITTAGLL